jgi:hypothetical protein
MFRQTNAAQLRYTSAKAGGDGGRASSDLTLSGIDKAREGAAEKATATSVEDTRQAARAFRDLTLLEQTIFYDDSKF